MAASACAPNFRGMKIKKLLPVVCVLALVSVTRIEAQNQLLMVFTGQCATTDSTGHIISTPINNKTLLSDYAQANGVTNTSGLGLAYHLGGNELGDTIDVINRTNGATIFTIFGLYFGEDFGRPALLSSSKRQMQRIEYIYTAQNSHSLGSALLTNYFFLNSDGTTNKTYVLGQMQYLVAPDATHTNTQVCTATFTTLRPWTFSQ
jgi:hypothetical protein